MAANRDPSTLSNYSAWRTRHTTASFKIDFEEKALKGSVILQLESQTDKESNEIILDMWIFLPSVSTQQSPSGN
jgi:leukotriene-A4 hydrolase